MQIRNSGSRTFPTSSLNPANDWLLFVHLPKWPHLVREKFNLSTSQLNFGLCVRNVVFKSWLGFKMLVLLILYSIAETWLEATNNYAAYGLNVNLKQYITYYFFKLIETISQKYRPTLFHSPTVSHYFDAEA